MSAMLVGRLAASGVTLKISSTYITVQRRQLQDYLEGGRVGWMGTLKNLRNFRILEKHAVKSRQIEEYNQNVKNLQKLA